MLWATGQNAQLTELIWLKSPESNFTKHGFDGSLDIAVIPVVLGLPEYLLVSEQPSKDGESELLLQKMDVLGPKIFLEGDDFHGSTTINK